jgi:integrase/recombinase XerD
MLSIWRWHNPKRCSLKGRLNRKCKCRIWISGIDASGVRVKESTKLRDWNRAEILARNWDAKGSKPVQEGRATIEDWNKAFMADASSAAGKNLNPETLRKYKLLFRQIDEFATQKGYRFVNQLDLTALTEFQSTWNISPLTASKTLERLRSVLKFAQRRKWIADNPAVDLSSPRLTNTPTLPFSEPDMKKILKVAKSKVKALILVMRYSGLRISDATTLAVESVKGKRIRLYQAKTGEYVYVPIPARVVKALNAIKPKPPRPYFFWTGHSKVQSVVSNWRAKMADVFKAAGIENGHSHRLRDSFAVSLLEAGVSLENVSVLLGHKSIRVTEKHYGPWVKSRQDMLDREVLKVISNRGRA